MAREHARVKLSIWDDDDFRRLSTDAQHLYFVLLTHSSLDYAGVADWRPARLAPFAGDWSVEKVETAAQELSEALYIVIDEASEEVLLRSFIRNDGLMESPNMAVAMQKAHRSVASADLRAIVVHELIRLHDDYPDLNGWSRVSEMLSKASLDPSARASFHPSANPSGNPSANPSGNPSGTGRPNPSGNPSGNISPTTAPSSMLPTPNSKEGPRKRGTRIPDGWKPSEQDVAWQRSEGISDLIARRELPKFVDWWTAKAGRDGVKLDWSATWRNWLRRTVEQEPRTGPARPDGWEFGQ